MPSSIFYPLSSSVPCNLSPLRRNRPLGLRLLRKAWRQIPASGSSSALRLRLPPLRSVRASAWLRPARYEHKFPFVVLRAAIIGFQRFFLTLAGHTDNSAQYGIEGRLSRPRLRRSPLSDRCSSRRRRACATQGAPGRPPAAPRTAPRTAS